MALDEIDLSILKILQSDAKVTIKEIANQLDLTITPTYLRVKKLEKEGVIKKYMALIDRQKLGFELMVFCEVSLKSHSIKFIEEFMKAIENVPDVVECFHIAGPYDYLLKVVVRNMEEYEHFILHRLASLNNIGKVQSMFVLREVMPAKVEIDFED